uniref:Uncharacterized protein n=1 Tax=Chromera velia CCMP2878 TaxID=1169474 RepID=A0A0G4FC84_9ALVE|mmetsp:Transcript_32988/g.65324  ORF Transcript_32988/g.65324 Transcript_32988/m.65324 type:complete len:729 (-) Transcript_32988:943-3129(-)|eukprot:Cvel_3196.t1-p1 / transcript=Cvel_3196.t1 / gene=Cvel_3196 / organism=Chromera_velia_CCMP2878 / gene_product=hypothetical protein / transcript_product=hypothetical protein / location=Cvel_scaffold124:116607-122784(+) / protein_length=728 / sequence_SO=supercontig / SO=protein_coding / is_pseudo=false
MEAVISEERGSQLGCVHVDSEGKKVILGALDGAATVDLQSRESVQLLGAEQAGATLCVLFTRDGTTAVVSSQDRRLRTFELPSGKMTSEAVLDSHAISLTESADESVLVAGGMRGRVTAWRRRDGSLFCPPVQVHTGPVMDVAVLSTPMPAPAEVEAEEPDKLPLVRKLVACVSEGGGLKVMDLEAVVREKGRGVPGQRDPVPIEDAPVFLPLFDREPVIRLGVSSSFLAVALKTDTIRIVRVSDIIAEGDWLEKERQRKGYKTGPPGRKEEPRPPLPCCVITMDTAPRSLALRGSLLAVGAGTGGIQVYRLSGGQSGGAVSGSEEGAKASGEEEEKEKEKENARDAWFGEKQDNDEEEQGEGANEEKKDEGEQREATEMKKEIGIDLIAQTDEESGHTQDVTGLAFSLIPSNSWSMKLEGQERQVVSLVSASLDKKVKVFEVLVPPEEEERNAGGGRGDDRNPPRSFALWEGTLRYRAGVDGSGASAAGDRRPMSQGARPGPNPFMVSGARPATAMPSTQPKWNDRFFLTFSRYNHLYHPLLREYFDHDRPDASSATPTNPAAANMARAQSTSSLRQAHKQQRPASALPALPSGSLRPPTNTTWPVQPKGARTMDTTVDSSLTVCSVEYLMGFDPAQKRAENRQKVAGLLSEESLLAHLTKDHIRHSKGGTMKDPSGQPSDWDDRFQLLASRENRLTHPMVREYFDASTPLAGRFAHWGKTPHLRRA